MNNEDLETTLTPTSEQLTLEMDAKNKSLLGGRQGRAQNEIWVLLLLRMPH